MLADGVARLVFIKMPHLIDGGVGFWLSTSMFDKLTSQMVEYLNRLY
jgi:hypothetical protein